MCVTGRIAPEGLRDQMNSPATRGCIQERNAMSVQSVIEDL